MAPRKKKAETPPVQEPVQLEIEDAIKNVPRGNPADLIKEYFTLKEHVETQSKAFAEYLKPSNTRIEQIKSALHAMALEQKVNGFPTDEGTAYLSTITSHKVSADAEPYTNQDGRTSTGRDALLDWMLDNWDEYGSESMQLNIAKAGIEKWQEATQSEEFPNGKVPPGLALESFVRINIKRS
jgi:hypothetical protein